MTKASSGIGASFATALITPRAMITVPFSSRGPETGTTVTPRMAKYCGSPPCAAIRGAKASIAARMKTTLQTNATVRPKKECIPNSSSGLPREAKIHRASFEQRQEASGKLPRSQAHTRFCGKQGTSEMGGAAGEKRDFYCLSVGTVGAALLLAGVSLLVSHIPG